MESVRRIYLDASIPTFPPNDRPFLLQRETFHISVLTALVRARFFSNTAAHFLPREHPARSFGAINFSPFPVDARSRRPFIFSSLARASRRYRDLRPVKRGNEQDVDNDDTLTRSAHRFLLLATGINSGRARALSYPK